MSVTVSKSSNVQRATDVLHALKTDPPSVSDTEVFTTGFDRLDEALEGGFRVHDLVLLGGLPGVGKTVAALQWSRHLAKRGVHVVYACYEHDESDLLARLLALEVREAAHPDNAPALGRLRNAVRDVVRGLSDFKASLEREPLIRLACDELETYSDRLFFLRAFGGTTDLEQLDLAVSEHTNGGAVLIVDYLQKVPMFPDPPTEAEKVRRVAEGLKDIALDNNAAVVGIVAADQEALSAPRLRAHHLRGSSALAYESDVIVVMNDKVRIVSKAHLAYDSTRVEDYRSHVVFTVEKNRMGPTGIDVEFRKDLSSFRFDPVGRIVSERLVDERFQLE